ncbi:hypothetical protein Ahy_A08g037511 [Arachis hypogaea]|uniref:Uncharacterized protein n=1 Tax=Arachis hypogaea TaxID=3818 RepID=A0A445BR01_ARAHY|nr:hypothetical protein Ahy_A08g037511 [Arachis hypogaea]
MEFEINSKAIRILIGDWNEQFRNRDDELPKYMHNGGRESGPPSSSGPGHLSFREATGIRLPLGFNWSEHRPVKAEAAGSSPVSPE